MFESDSPPEKPIQVRLPESLTVSGPTANPSTLLVALIMIALNAPTAWAAGPATDCRLKQFASIVVDYSADAPPTVPIVIDNHAVRAWLNSAAAFTMIDQEALEQLGKLKVREFARWTPEITSGSKRITGYVVVPEVSLGNALFKNVEMLVRGTHSSEYAGPIEGTPIAYLGMDFLTRVDIELDFGHHRMNLFSPDHCPGEVVYWADHYDVVPMRRGALKELYFVMELNRKKLQTLLATADASSTLYANVASDLFGWGQTPLGLPSMSENGSSGSDRTMTLTSGGLTIVNAQIGLRSVTKCIKDARTTTDRDGALGFDTCHGAFPLYLGRNVLSKLRVYLSTREEKMYFTTVDAHKQGSVPLAQ